MVFAHGFGCNQNMWRFVAREFENDFKVVLFDHVGAGGSDLSAYDQAKYSTLHGYADDLVEIVRELGLKDAVLVGHSVSAMIGVLASLKAPGLFGRMVLVGPSAKNIDDGDYVTDAAAVDRRRAKEAGRLARGRQDRRRDSPRASADPPSSLCATAARYRKRSKQCARWPSAI